ncbi:hypothetical protein HGRIS_002585 [Hohenbuehelia grisea]|uniref:UTP--glucose-1-phosphate uridylyltransferase n=1 Tax=Hohenbuehelia grisea TaxID=104357 RepID=A0ABR3JLM6_9AGAR
MLFFRSPFRRTRRRATQRLINSSRNPISAAVGNELEQLLPTVSSQKTLSALQGELQSFLSMFNRYLEQPTLIDWDNVKPPSTGRIVSYDKLPRDGTSNSDLQRLAVLKLNGGLGSSMAMKGAKSALEVKDNLTFLDLAVEQIAFLNTTHHVDVPLLLMTSFSTQEDTLRVVQKHSGEPVRIMTFNQSRFPRIMKDSLSLYTHVDNIEDRSAWYPPGHGDVYHSLAQSGLLDSLLSEGKEFLFISNSDNLGSS